MPKKLKHRKKKFIPIYWFYDEECQTEDNPSGFCCYFEEGIWDKYGLHYNEHNRDKTEVIHLKGKRYSKRPYAYNSYEEMMKVTEYYAKSAKTANDVGNIRREAIYLILELDQEGNLLYDPHSFDGYVSKRGTVFNITSSGNYGGKKSFALTDKNKHLVFTDIGKAAVYVRQHYGKWAMFHYLKSFPGSL